MIINTKDLQTVNPVGETYTMVLSWNTLNTDYSNSGVFLYVLIDDQHTVILKHLRLSLSILEFLYFKLYFTNSK